jgi:hypothetical protein
MRNITEVKRIRRCVQSPDPNGEVYQLRVEWEEEDSTLIEVAVERMTSNAPDSQVVKGTGQVLCLSDADATWLLEALLAVRTHKRDAEARDRLGIKK